MANRQRIFVVPKNLSDDELLQPLRKEHLLSSASAIESRYVFHDSFDRRLYKSGTLLQENHDHRGKRLEWRQLKNGDLLETLVLEGDAPRFVWDFPNGGLGGRLQPVLAMRALLPFLEVIDKGHLYNLLNEDEKTVVRLVLETSQARNPGKGDGKPLGRYLRLLPVKGYDREMERVVRVLGKAFDLQKAPQVVIDQALGALGRTAVDYSSKLSFRFDPDKRSDDAVKEIHLFLLGVLEANMPGTRADTDSEFLHDLRVAVRRTRSALTQIKGVFDEEVVTRFKEGFAWVGEVTGPTRDMDVYLLGFDQFRNSLPKQYRSDLNPLQAFLVAHQKSEQRAMVRKLNSPHFRTLLKEWRTFLETPSPQVPLAVNAVRPVKEVASQRIYKMYKLVLKEGLAITADSAPEELHELRKSCKKLRYLMEFFQHLYPKKQIRPLVKELKKLLDNLGEFQDREVQAEKLREFGRQMKEEGEVPSDTLLAMGMLVDGLLRSQQLARARFSDRFDAFAVKDNRSQFKGLFAPGGKGAEG
jgi:CHAD domain-containing protein